MSASDLIVLTVLLICCAAGLWAYRRFAAVAEASVVVVGADLSPMCHRLAQSAWGPKGAQGLLALDPNELSGVPGDAELVAKLLNHVRKVAPRLSVPFLTPRIRVTSIPDAAGLFQEQDGWVTISVSSTFFLERRTACAILCHEVCHYILNANGIREPDTIMNERLTDVAMFVLGLGDVFLAGYRSDTKSEYAPGHRLGYLSDAEYRFVDDSAFELWASGRLQPTREEELECRLAARIRDSEARRRFVEAMLEKHPHISREDAIERVLYQYERDQR